MINMVVAVDKLRGKAQVDMEIVLLMVVGRVGHMAVAGTAAHMAVAGMVAHMVAAGMVAHMAAEADL